MWWLLLALAYADDFTPEVRRRVPPEFPPDAPWALDVKCRARLTVGPDGRVRDVEITSEYCLEPFRTETVEAYSKWTFERWTAPPETATFESTMLFKASGPTSVSWDVLVQVIEAYDEVPSASEDCVIDLTVHPNGDLSDLTSSALPGCAAVPAGGPVLPDPWPAGAACTLEFQASGGAAVDLSFLDCPEPLQDTARRTAKQWTWVQNSKRTIYRATLRYVE